MNIVIPLGKSKIDYLDLRYCLRSIERHCYGYDEIVIVGERPSWIQGAIHISHSDDLDKKFKERNILKKLIAACISPQNKGTEFAMFNDDYVLLQDMDLNSLPYYYKGTWQESYEANRGKTYRITAYHTIQFLKDRGFKDYNFDGHVPIVYNKKKFLTTFDDNDINFKTPYGYGIKTLYSACNKVKPVYLEDVKFQKSYPREKLLREMEGRKLISFNDHPLKTDLGQILKEIYPKKSTYER